MPYQHDRDLPFLRSVLRALNQQDKIGPVTFHKHYDGFRMQEPSTVVSKATIQRMMDAPGEWPEAGKGKPQAAAELYRFVFTKSPYRARALVENGGVDGLAEEASTGDMEAGDGSPEAALSRALQCYLLTEKSFAHVSMKHMRVWYPGKYVMYRADLRPYALRTPARPQFRASSVEISVRAGTLLIRELQDLARGENEDPLHMKTAGLMFPYGRFAMFLMHATGMESLRMGVIGKIYTFVNNEKVHWFSGTILVASEADLFPSTKFFCLRDDGTLKNGKLSLVEIPNSAARSYLQDAHRVAAAHYGFDLPSVIKP